jgi:tartrate dehydrogenase/decarboxylase/D-malate dehydrogenase
MKQYRLAVIAGDGIGVEVVPAAIRVLEAAAARAGAALAWEHFPWGSAYYFAHGRMMPPDAIATLQPFDAIFFGAVGDPRLQDNVTLNGLLLPIRRAFDQYACVRPAVLYPGVRGPLAGKQPGEIDFVVVRENTEGEYAQIGGTASSPRWPATTRTSGPSRCSSTRPAWTSSAGPRPST